MSKLKRKYELENKIDQYITDINREISTLESDFTFISEEDGEIKSRVFYDPPRFNGISLKFYDSFLLDGDELDRFFAYIDNIRREIKKLKTTDKVDPSVISPEELARCLHDDLLI